MDDFDEISSDVEWYEGADYEGAEDEMDPYMDSFEEDDGLYDAEVQADAEYDIVSGNAAPSTPPSQSASITASGNKPKESALSQRIITMTADEQEEAKRNSTIYRIDVCESLNDMKKRAGSDEKGEKPLVLFLGQGIAVDETTPHVWERINANQKKPEATIQTLSGNPGVLLDPQDVVTGIQVSGKSDIPNLELVLNNISLSGRSTRHSVASEADDYVQHPVVRCEVGQELNKEIIFSSPLSAKDARMYARYGQNGPEQLNRTVYTAIPTAGREMIGLEFDDPNNDLIIERIQSDLLNWPGLTEEERALAVEGKMPDNILHVDSRRPNIVEIPKSLYEETLSKCRTAMKTKVPLSDVAHPFGTLARHASVFENHFSDSNDDDLNAFTQRKIWSHPRGLDRGANDQAGFQRAMDRCRTAHFIVKVRHASLRDVNKEKDADQ